MNRRPTKSPTLEAMKADGTGGLCICCDGPLPPRKHQERRLICDDAECMRLYHKVYDMGRNWKRGA